MEYTEQYSKILCMTELGVAHTIVPEENYFEASDHAKDACFFYTIRGNMTLRSAGGTPSGGMMNIPEGSLVYIPEGATYSALWNNVLHTGIEYYRFSIVSRKFDTANTDRYVIQRIDALSCQKTGEIFAEIFKLFSTLERLDRVKAIAKYYDFYAEVLPHLTENDPIRFHPALLAAMEFIDRHYQEDFSMEQLAQAVCVSPSRLFHLFRDELGTSPIKYRNEIRIIHASHALATGDDPIEQIADENGFNSVIYFRETFKAVTGLRPTEYRTLTQYNKRTEG